MELSGQAVREIWPAAIRPVFIRPESAAAPAPQPEEVVLRSPITIEPADAGKNPPATIAWGEAVNGVQAGLVPLGGGPGGRWGEGSALFCCSNCAGKPRKATMHPSVAADKRVCAVCGTPKPWSATFIEGEPLRMELHVRNLAKEERSLYDARHQGSWRFTFAEVGGDKAAWEMVWGIEDERTVEGIAKSTITLGVSEQNAVDMGLERYSLRCIDYARKQLVGRSLPPGKYTVTATYAHPGHEQGKPCPYWHGTVTTGAVEIEIKAVEPETEARREAKKQAERQAEVERERQIEREREMKQRETTEPGQ